MAAEDNGFCLLSQHIYDRTDHRNRISERDFKIQRKSRSGKCDLWIFSLRAVLGIWFLGAYIGAVMSVSILQFGFAGGLIGLGLLLPQYLFYIPASLYLMRQVWEMSAGIWRNKGLFPERIGVYLLRSSAACGIYLIGILAECCLNPWIVEKLLSYIKIF